MNNLNQLYPRRSSNQILFLLADIITFKERFDNGGAGRRAAYTVFFQSIASLSTSLPAVSMARNKVASV